MRPETIQTWTIALMAVSFSIAAEPALIHYEWSEDFERGTTAGWSSYPPFQDTAYDYSILAGYYRPPETLQGYIASGEFFYPVELAPSEKPEGNKFYCLRSYRPNSTHGQRIGVTRKLSCIVGEDSKFGFDLWAKRSGFAAVDVFIQLACSDGRRYENGIGMVGVGGWLSWDIPATGFYSDEKRLEAGLEVQAIVIEVHYSRVDPASFYHVAIDNVRLNGKRRAGFRFQEPKIEFYDHWPLGMAQTHFNTGDTLDLVANPEVRLKRATARLESFQGVHIVSERELVFRDSTWTADGFHIFSAGDPTGPLKLILEGETKEGETVKTEVRLWHLPDSGNSGRPNLLFKSDEIEELRSRTKSGRSKEIWESIRGQAEKARKKTVPEKGQVEEFPPDYLIQQLVPYFDAVRGSAWRAMLNAWVFAIEGDEEAGAYAKDALLNMTKWKTWTHPWFLTQGRKTYYPVGLASMYSGIAYDLIRPLLSDEEAAVIRKGVLKNGIENAYEEYFIDNRVPNHTSNWVSHCTAGPLVALCAFRGDTQGEERANIDRLFAGLGEKFIAHCRATFTPDGGYGEGYGYQNFTMESASPFLAAMENLYRADNLAASLDIAESYLFPVYISVEEGKTLLDMGDSSDKPGTKTNWAWLSQRLDDPLLKNFYNMSPGAEWEDFLWFEEDPTTSGPESLPPSRYFPGKGNVVFRTGWGKDDVVLNYHAGPHFNHTHADQGNFLMWAFGEELVSEGGKAGYYTDPYYWSYFIQAGAHNTILADGISESQEVGDFKNEVEAFDRRGRIEKVHLSDPFSLVVSELAPVYRGSHKGVLERFTRTVCFVDPGYVVVWDRLRSGGDETYQWQLFPPKAEVFSIEGNGAKYEGEKARLKIEILSPENLKLDVLKRPIQMGEYVKYPDEPLHPRSVLQIDGGTAEEGIEFLVALFPSRRGEPSMFQAEKMARDGAIGVRVIRAGGTDEILFDESEEGVSFERKDGDGASKLETVDLSGGSESSR